MLTSAVAAARHGWPASLTFSFEYEPRTEDGEAYRFTVRKSTIPGPIISNSYNLETIGLDANHQARIGFTGSSSTLRRSL